MAIKKGFSSNSSRNNVSDKRTGNRNPDNSDAVKYELPANHLNQHNAWKNLSRLCPSLPRHIVIHRRHYHGELWYLLQDKANGKFHRFRPEAYRFIGLMDGRRNLQQILDASIRRTNDTTPTPDELLEVVQFLHVSDLLLCDIPPETEELFSRKAQQERQKWRSLILNPLIWRFPLADPNAWLDRWQPIAQGLAKWPMGLCWLVVVAYALVQSSIHWSELTASAINQVWVPQNLFWLWLTYPVMKILHEFGHALFTKAWGGDVHEVGIVVVMGMPLPYVDASAATGFASKGQRLMVGAAGMAVELFLAALALLVWLQLEPGQFRALTFNIIILGSVSTLFFNGNPLMRFDGYHILCDAIDLPNLASRANQQIGYTIMNYGYGVQGLAAPADTRREAVSLIAYGVAAFCYRLLIITTIILLVWQYFPSIGITLGMWFAFFQIFLPLFKQVLNLFNSPRLSAHRHRAIAVTVSILAGLVFVCFFVPLPQSTRAEGVFWLPDDARVRAESEGFVAEVLAFDGDSVTRGQALIRLNNLTLINELEMQKALLREQQARYQAAWGAGQVQVKLITEDIATVQAQVTDLEQRVETLIIRSRANGTLRLSDAHGLTGRYLRQGDWVATVTAHTVPRVRVVLEQDEIGLVMNNTRAVEVKLTEAINVTLKGVIGLEIPAATYLLPSAALGSSGGGRLAVDAKNEEGNRTQQLVFLLDLFLPDLPPTNHYGERVYVRFDHSPETFATQVYRLLRRPFLKLMPH